MRKEIGSARIRRPWYTMDGQRQQSRNYHVHFVDHLHCKRRVTIKCPQCKTDRARLSVAQRAARCIERLVYWQSQGLPMGRDEEAAKWARYEAGDNVRDKLIGWGILPAGTVGPEPETSQGPALADMVADFERSLSTEAETITPYARLVGQRVRTVLGCWTDAGRRRRQRLGYETDGCGCTTFEEIAAEKVIAYLKRRKQGAHPITVQTRQHYIRAVRQFCKWATKNGLAEKNPLRDFDTKDLLGEKVHNSTPRPFEVAEFQKLIATVETLPPAFGLSGRDRAMLYRVAAATGYRRDELRHLTVDGIDFRNRTIRLSGRFTKNGDDATQPIPQDLADDLRAYVQDKTPTAPLFARVTDKTAKMIQADCTAAGIPLEDRAGPTTFHSLRHTFGTWLAAAGVHPKQAQELMRHSDIKLTMNLYTHTVHGGTRRAVDSLPSMRPAEGVKTGPMGGVA